VTQTRIYLVGFIGAGKTTVGRRLAKKLGWTFLDLDEEIERRERRAIAEIFKAHGEPHFRNLECSCLKDLCSRSETVIALGGGAFISPENREIAETTGLTVWLKVSFGNIRLRVKIDGTRPNFSDPEKARLLFDAREPFYALARVHVSTDDRTPDSIADEIIGVLQRS
jgi:shikimate kinase